MLYTIISFIAIALIAHHVLTRHLPKRKRQVYGRLNNGTIKADTIGQPSPVSEQSKNRRLADVMISDDMIEVGQIVYTTDWLTGAINNGDKVFSPVRAGTTQVAVIRTENGFKVVA